VATLVACRLVFPQHFLLFQMLTCVYLTNRSHLILLCVCSVVDHRLRCRNKQVAHEVIAECVTDVLTTFWRPLWSITNRYMATCNLFVLYNKNLTTAFLFQNLSQLLESLPLPTLANTKKARLVQKNQATVKFDLNGFSWNENLLLKLLEYFCREISYFFLLLVSVQCLDNTILYLIFSQSHNILSLFSKLSVILKYRRKNLCNDGINHASVL